MKGEVETAEQAAPGLGLAPHDETKLVIDVANARGATPAERERRADAYRRAERALFARDGLAAVERRLALAGLGTSIRVWEQGAGEPMVFLHGAPNAGGVWAALASRLGGFRRILVDRPGCGLSAPLPPGLWRTPTDTVLAVTDALLDSLALARTTLVANSLGGAWALWYARNRPERISALVLEGCPALVPGMQTPAAMRWLTASGLYRLSARFRLGPRSARALVKRNGHGRAIESGRIPPEHFRWSAALFSHTRTARHDFDLLARALTWRGIDPRLRLGEDLLREVRCPTLVLWGDRDPFGGPDAARRVRCALPDARLEIFRDSGHMPWIDAPDDHAGRVRSFLAEQ